MAEELVKRWKSYGFDKVEMPEYEVLLSFPQKDKPNTVTLYKGDTVIHQIKTKEKVCKVRFNTDYQMITFRCIVEKKVR